MTEVPAAAQEDWERLPNEPDLAWTAFKAFRDMGAKSRAIKAVADGMGRRPTQVYKWAGAYRWRERAEAYDRFLDAQDVRYAEELRQQGLERRAKVADMMLDVAEAQLRKWIDDSAMGISPKITPTDVARLVEAGVKIQRLENGESTENLGVSGRITTIPDVELLDRAREILSREVKR